MPSSRCRQPSNRRDLRSTLGYSMAHSRATVLHPLIALKICHNPQQSVIIICMGIHVYLAIITEARFRSGLATNLREGSSGNEAVDATSALVGVARDRCSPRGAVHTRNRGHERPSHLLVMRRRSLRERASYSGSTRRPHASMRSTWLTSDVSDHDVPSGVARRNAHLAGELQL